MKDRYVATVNTTNGVKTLKGEKLEGLCKQCDNLPGMTGYYVNDTKMHNWQVAKYDNFVPEKKGLSESEVAMTTLEPVY